MCPKGWHLPSRTEWDALIDAVGGLEKAGEALKSRTGWKAYEEITNDDTYAFSALSAGFIDQNGNFKHEGEQANFWTTEASSTYATSSILYYDENICNLSINHKNAAQSVRCIKNK